MDTLTSIEIKDFLESAEFTNTQETFIMSFLENSTSDISFVRDVYNNFILMDSEIQKKILISLIEGLYISGLMLNEILSNELLREDIKKVVNEIMTQDYQSEKDQKCIINSCKNRKNENLKQKLDKLNTNLDY